MTVMIATAKHAFDMRRSRKILETSAISPVLKRLYHDGFAYFVVCPRLLFFFLFLIFCLARFQSSAPLLPGGQFRSSSSRSYSPTPSKMAVVLLSTRPKTLFRLSQLLLDQHCHLSLLPLPSTLYCPLNHPPQHFQIAYIPRRGGWYRRI